MLDPTMVASVVGVAGAILVSFNNKWGWPLWSFTNTLWLFMSDSIWTDLMWGTFLCTTVIGFYLQLCRENYIAYEAAVAEWELNQP